MQYLELRYRRLFEPAKDGILILDATTAKVTDANPYLEEVLGYAPKTCVVMLPPPDCGNIR